MLKSITQTPNHPFTIEGIVATPVDLVLGVVDGAVTRLCCVFPTDEDTVGGLFVSGLAVVLVAMNFVLLDGAAAVAAAKVPVVPSVME